MTTTRNRILWTLQVLLALLFVFAGSMKLILPIAAMTQQMPMPGAFLRFLGVCEIAGALGLILPGALRIRQGLTPFAGFGLAVIMAGATVVSAMAGPLAAGLIPLTIGGLALVVAWNRLPAGDYRVERSVKVQAAPESIFPLIADFHQWAAWSPYEKLDPTMRKTLSGAPKGKGAVYHWAGKNKVGEGRMEIIEAAVPTNVKIQLDFIRPFEGHQITNFTLRPAGDSTLVVWTASGDTCPLARVMSLFFDMDKMIGKDFETGLANLKAIAEYSSTQTAA